jgi:hypothetical protein
LGDRFGADRSDGGRVVIPARGAFRRTPRDAPQGTPTVDQNAQSAGLTPQMAIVNTDLTPTVFFFRWLLNSRGAAQGTAQDSNISVNGTLVGSVTNALTVNGIALP